MFLQGNTFAPEKACPDGQSRRRRDFHTKGKRRGKKGDLPVAGAKKDSRACTAWHSPASGIAVPMSRMQPLQLSLPHFGGNMKSAGRISPPCF